MKPLSDIQTRRGLVSILAASGLGIQAIGEMLKEDGRFAAPVGTLANDQTLHNQYIDSIAPTDPDKARRMQIGRLELIQRLAIESFVESKETVTETTTVDAEGNESVKVSKRRSPGDSKFLVIARDVEIERSKILGVYAAKEEKQSGELRVIFSWGDGNPMQLPAGETVDVTPSRVLTDK